MNRSLEPQAQTPAAAMVKQSIEAKVRPLANASLERASLAGAARIYISTQSMLALTNGVNHGRLCVVDRLDPEPALRRHAVLWLLPDNKNLSPNVVMMTRAYQEATGFRIGDQVRITLAEDPLPDAYEVVVAHVTGGGGHEQQQQQQHPQRESIYPPGWEFVLSHTMDRAEQVFPGMVFEGVNVNNKIHRSFKVLSVNTKTTNLAKFQLTATKALTATKVRILEPAEQDSPSAGALSGTVGELVVGGVPGLAAQVDALNCFLQPFADPLFIKGERESCALVIHGGHGTGKTLILRRIEATRWGTAYWIRPSDKLSTLRETFRQARALQPSLVLVDGLEELLAKPNREAIIEALAEELDGLADAAAHNDALPRVVVVATCLDYMTDVPAKLRRRSRFRENVALPIPCAPERLEILTYLDPPLRPEDKERCLASIAGKTHAFNGDDLAALVAKAKCILGRRLRGPPGPRASSPSAPRSSPPLQQQQHFLHPDDMDQALLVTRPTAMHDINLKPPIIHWQDVGGQESLKTALARMVKIAKNTNPTWRLMMPHPPKGILLYGPPGCSKTLSAQAMATESGFNFFAVKGPELLNMYVGESERAVRTLFDRARAASPSIIFFDEIDSIGGQRSGQGAGASSAAVNMLTALLTEMDGFEALTGVLVLAATNRPEAIDPALMRPGRFEHLYVGPPDQSGREAVFAVHLRGVPLARDVDVPALARLACGYSGAEIKAICNEAGGAVMERLDERDEAGATERVELAMADLVAALDKTPRTVTQDMLDRYEAWRRQFKAY